MAPRRVPVQMSGYIRPTLDLRITSTDVTVNGVMLTPRERAKIAQPLVAEFLDERGPWLSEDEREGIELLARWLRNYL